ncbi:hypothetical protein V6N13_133704 [Hibiscus sabdariffa]|uniref:RING-type E3 ubiquitin transferase n=1 Tax=Hibiscus sabdariffa TaxID=183260 RepID=A0ABR2R0G9_9ROSI
MNSTAPMNRSSSDDITNTTLFLSPTSSVPQFESTTHPSVRRQSLREAARFMRRATSPRTMRETSMLVRESAAEQLEERQSDWTYSKLVVILDIIWNIAFVYLLHMVCVCVEYMQRSRRQRMAYSPFNSREEGILSPGLGVGSEQYVSLAQLEEDCGSNVTKHLETANTMFSFVWWIIGFYWVSLGGQAWASGFPPALLECCICLSAYDDGVELRELPCGHHFHCACVDKWLCINATCPLCKYNILKSSGQEEV